MKRQLKSVAAFAAAATMTIASVMTASAAGWKQDANGWWVENDDGTYLTNQWYQSPDSGLWYYMGADGYMLTNTTTPDGRAVNAEGVLVQNEAELSQQETVNGSTLLPSDFIIIGDSDTSQYNNDFLVYSAQEIGDSWGFFCYDQLYPVMTNRGITLGNSRADVINAYGNPSAAFECVTVENDGLYRYYSQIVADLASMGGIINEDIAFNQLPEYRWFYILNQKSCVQYSFNDHGMRFYFDQNDAVVCIAYFKDIDKINFD